MMPKEKWKVIAAKTRQTQSLIFSPPSQSTSYFPSLFKLQRFLHSGETLKRQLTPRTTQCILPHTLITS